MRHILSILFLVFTCMAFSALSHAEDACSSYKDEIAECAKKDGLAGYVSCIDSMIKKGIDGKDCLASLYLLKGDGYYAC